MIGLLKLIIRGGGPFTCMFDGGVGEAAVAEGAKGAGEAAAAEGAAGATAADAAGAGIAAEGAGSGTLFGTGGASLGGASGGSLLGSSTATGAGFGEIGAGAGAGLSSADTAALYGGAGYGEGASAAELAGSATGAASNSVLADSAAGTPGYGASSAGAGGGPGTGFGLSDALDAAKKANSYYSTGKNLKDGNYAGAAVGGLGIASDLAGAAGASSAPTGGVPDASGLPNPTEGVAGAAAPADAATTGAATTTPTPDLGNPDVTATGQGGPGTSLVSSPVTPAGDPSLIQKGIDALGGYGKDIAGAAKTAAPYAGLAASVYGQRQQAGAQKQFQKLAQPVSDASNQLLNQFKAGQLNPTDQYAIAQWSDQAKAQAKQYYAKAGLSNSSMEQSALAQIDAQGENMRQQAVQSLLTNGLKAAGVANPTLTAGINAGVKQDQETQTALADFMKVLAGMNTPVPGG